MRPYASFEEARGLVLLMKGMNVERSLKIAS